MRCPRCQHENPVGQKFCGECGARLATSCPGCGASNPPEQKFCGECGVSLTGTDARWKFDSPETYTPKHLAAKILTSRSTLEGERKQVTVLFADLKGSTELIADRDPEEARGLLDPILERMIEAVHRYEGIVTQVMGDGIMALFGAPLAHEDHAARACYAALRMQESVRQHADDIRRTHAVSLHIRVGLNSGDVVVRAIGNDLHMDYSAVGQTTHLAARMEQAAMPSSTFLAPRTVRLAEGFIETRPIGPIRLKGFSEPVEVSELIGARAGGSRFRAAVARGLTRFVGRDIELQHIRRTLAQSASGRGQVVAVAGEPGLGKTRLVWEITHSRDAQDWLVLECDSIPYERAIPYLPIIDLLKAYFLIRDRDGQREIREKITGKLLTLDRTLEPALPVFLSLLSVPVEDPEWTTLDPPHRRQSTLDAVKRLFLRESQIQPLLLVVENLHWIDSETQVLLDTLVDGLPAARVLLLVNYRPEYTHRWGSKTYFAQLRLDPLPAETAEEFLRPLLGDDATLGSLKRLLIDRTGGNPFFLEESVQALVETGELIGYRGMYHLARPLRELPLPATVQSLLAARLDRLAPTDKRLLQAASVIGKNIPFAVLRAVARLSDDEIRDSLSRLQRAEFLYEAAIYPDLEYTFKHALTQDVAYGSLLQEQRREWHRQVGEAIERLSADHTEELAGVLARHFVESGDLTRGLRYSLLAAEQASRIFAHDDALRHYERARVCAEAQNSRDHLISIDEAVGDVNLLRGQLQEAVGSYERAIAQATTRAKRAALKLKIGETYAQSADPRGLPILMAATDELDPDTQANEMALATAIIGRYHHYAGRHAKAIEWLERARELAEPLGRPVTLWRIYGYLAGANQFLGRCERAIEWARRCLEMGERGNQPRAVAHAYEWLAENMNILGRWEESLMFSARSREVSKRIGADDRIAFAHHNTARSLYGKGDLIDAAASAEAGLAMVEGTGDSRAQGYILNLLSVIEADMGQDDSAEAHARAAEEQGHALPILSIRTSSGYASMQREEWQQAHEYFDQKRRRFVDSDGVLVRFWIDNLAAEVAVRLGRSEDALQIVADTLTLMRQVGTRHYEGIARRVQAQALASLRYWDEAIVAFNDAASILEANGSRLELGRAIFHRGLMYQARGDADLAQADLTQARAIFESTGARRDLERATRALAAKPATVTND